ncbi:MAG: deoxyribonuclease IV [bacterium]
MRLGIHCSIRNGLVSAVEEAKAIGCESMQIFTRSPRAWKTRSISDSEASEFKDALIKSDIHPLVVHTPYLPNLCSSNVELYNRSMNALSEDIKRGAMLGGSYLIIHPGSYSEGKTEVEGTKQLIRALNVITKEIPDDFMILIETMAGGGRRLGNSFLWMRMVLDKLNRLETVGFCIDTCHLYGAGYDLSKSDAGVILKREIENTVTWDKVKVVHLNDSKAMLGSHKDMHQHIGKGFIGIRGFREFINWPSVKKLTGILETPKDSENADRRNLTLLRKLDKSKIK